MLWRLGDGWLLIWTYVVNVKVGNTDGANLGLWQGNHGLPGVCDGDGG